MIPAPEDLSPLPTESPSLLGRVGQQLGNAPSDILNDLMRLGFNVGIRDPNQTEALAVPHPYEIPEAKTGPETAVDVGAAVVRSLPLFLSGEGVGAGVGEVTGAGKVLSNMMRVGGGFATQGLSESKEQAAVSGAAGAGFGAVESMLPGPMKILAAGALGLGTGLEAKREGASDKMATVQGITNAILPLITGRRAPVAAVERAAKAEPQTANYLTYPARPLLEDVQSATKIPGTGGPIPYGGELPESTTRARPIFGTERFPVKEGEFVDVPRNGQPPPALLDAPRAITPITPTDLPNPMAPPGSLTRETSITGPELCRGLGVTAPEGSLIREPRFSPEEALQYVRQINERNLTTRNVTPKEISGEMYGESRWTHVVDVTDNQGKAIGKIRGNVTEDGFQVKGANIEKSQQGQGNYQKVIRQLAERYGNVQSDIDMQPAAEAAWKKVGAELQADGSYKLSQSKIATLQPKPVNRLLLSTVLSHENEAMAKKAADKLGVEFKGFWPGSNHIEFKIPEGSDSPAAGANLTLSPGSTFKDLKNKVAEKNKQFAAGSQGGKVVDVTPKETVVSAAFKIRDTGEVLTGTSHGEIMDETNHPSFHVPITNEMRNNNNFPSILGYATSKGRFVEPREAAELARRNRNLRAAREPIAQNFTSIKEQKVATLQSKAGPSLPSSLETDLPHGLKVGDKAVVFFEGERTVGTIHPGVEPELPVRFVDSSGTPHDVAPSQLKPLGTKPIKTTANVESVGGLQDIEAAADAASREGGGMTLGSGGSRMKLSNFGEHGSITPELLHVMGVYVAPAAIGAAVGYAEDDQHRLGSAVMGAVIGGALGHFGVKALRLLAEGHPDIKTPGSLAERLSRIGTAAKDDTVDFAKAVVGNPSMAARAASRWGLSSGFDRMSRWIEKNVGVNPAATRFLDKAHGKIEDLSEIMRMSIRGLSHIEGIDRYFNDVNTFFEGKMTFTDFAKKVPDEVAALAATAMQTRTALQNVVLAGLGPGKLSTKIQDSIGNYLTTSYKIFHDAKYKPSDAQIEAAAKSMSADWGNLDTRLDLIHEYLHEIKATKGLFTGGSSKGATLNSLLARTQDITPEFKEMLGIYDNPLERMGFTAVKLVNAARSAEYFNEVARGIKPNGLKYAYTRAEREGEIATLQSQASLAHSPAERDAAMAKLTELKDYVSNSDGAASGRLANTFMDRRMRDQLANYDAATKLFTGPLARQFANATNLIKYGQVILSPLQFVRQIYSMPILGIMAKTTPVDWLKAFKTINDKSETGIAELRRLKQLGVYGGDPVGGMLRKDMRALMEGSLDKIIGDRLRHGLHQWEEMWRQPDLIVRVSAFQRKEAELLGKYGSSGAQRATDEAIDHMNRYTMNYGAVPPIVMKGRQMPFINQYLSFAYEAMRIGKNLGQDALKGDLYSLGALATVATAPFIIQQMSEAALSPADREEWAKVKNLGKDYERHNFRFVTGRNPNGDFRYILFSPLVVHDPWLQSIRAIMAGDSSALSAANPVFGWENTPLLNVATSLVSGRNRISGDKLYTFADYAESVRRDVAPILLGTDLDRIKRAITANSEGGMGVIDQRTGKVSSVSDIIQTYATSMRPYTVRPAYLLHQAQAEAVDNINQQQRMYRSVLATNAAPQVKAQAKDNFDRALQHILLSFKEKYGISLTPEPTAGAVP